MCGHSQSNTQMCSTNSITDALLPVLSREESTPRLCTYTDSSSGSKEDIANHPGNDSLTFTVSYFTTSRYQVEVHLSWGCVVLV